MMLKIIFLPPVYKSNRSRVGLPLSTHLRARIRSSLALVILVLFGASLCRAQATYTAASAAQSDVNAVVNGPTHKAVNGDVIQIPCSGAQTVTWSSQLSVSASIKIKALGGTPNTTASTFGSGTNCLTILDNNTSGPVFSFNTTYASTNNVSTLENINIDPITASTRLVSPVHFNGTCTASGCPLVRADNIVFGKTVQWNEGGNGSSANWMIRANNVFGVFDHDTLPSGSQVDFLSAGLDSYLGVGDYGDNSWAQPDTFGQQGALYVENSILHTNEEFTDCEMSPTGTVGGGCRLVGRFNELTAQPGFFVAFGVHGLDTGGRTRGGRQIEAYNNTLNCAAAACASGISAYRGGTGFSFNNTLTGGSYNTITGSTIYRTVYSPSPWGACGGLNSKGPWDTNDNVVYFSGTALAGGLTMTDNSKSFPNLTSGGAPYTLYDVTQNFMSEIRSNTATTLTIGGPISESGWIGINSNDSYQIIRATVCADQGGRGRGIYVSGLSPTPAAPLNQALDPIYAWNNPASGLNFGYFGSISGKLIANRDYYLDATGSTPPGAQTSPTSPFNGTSGVGYGTLANRPACSSPACAAGVGYWATDQGNWNQSGGGGQGVLYTWNGSSWGVHYIPYTYPHPLTTGSTTTSGQPPQAPTGLTASVQ
jgi:hypothetical protein